MPSAFLDIVAAFALFRRSGINLLIIVIILHDPIYRFFCCVCICTIAFSLLHIHTLIGKERLDVLSI